MRAVRRPAWCPLLLGLALALALGAARAAGHEPAADPGEAIYRRGVLPSGAPLQGRRDDQAAVVGAAAACANCHQRSGLGMKEGRSVIPPVAGRYLFEPAAARDGAGDLPYVEGMRTDRPPYTEQTLARAVREGIDSQGRPMSYLMPRFELGDGDMAALTSHLNRLGRVRAPGVTDGVLHFATIVTPEADPARRKGMLDVLENFFAERNATQPGATAKLRPSDHTSFAQMMFKVRRQWQLHVWQLGGPASSWGEQLDRLYAAQPVFAVVSGVAGRTWQPVHAFCERAALPCLFPNVELPPPEADHDFYSLYLSRGVLLEADLIAGALRDDAGGAPPRRVHQLYRAGDSGEAGALALAARLRGSGSVAVPHALPRDAAPGRAPALPAGLGPDDALVLWLRPDELAALPSAPPAVAAVYLSGRLGGLERASLPAAWRGVVRMAYGFDLPERRRVRVNYALGWFTIRHIPVVDEQVQVDTYLACGLLAETLTHMADAFVRDYLVERLQDTLEHRVLTGYYPRLSLATGQRFASKGGYIVHFAGPDGPRLRTEGDWQVP